MKVSELIKLTDNYAGVRIFSVRTVCGAVPCDSERCDCCDEFIPENITSEEYKGEACNVPIKLAEKKIKEVSVCIEGRGRRAVVMLSIEVERVEI